LKFQSIQTLVYQASVTLLFLGGGFISTLILAVFSVLAWSNFSSDFNSPMAIVGLVIFIVFMLIAMFSLLIVPLFHIVGQWAGYRVLKGDNYRYPLVGSLVERQISTNSTF
jgi:uncharacterized Tic20 family protein